MHATERLSAGFARDPVKTGARQAAMAADHDVDVVLKPLSRPELGDIRVDGVFAVGRTEHPFASFPQDIQAMLSRRHARVFCEDGAVYVADLESRNGTTVNRSSVGQSPCRLSDGDELCFGGVLAYRVQIKARTAAAQPDAFVLTLTPESGTSSLEPIVITGFPFLVSKTDPAFARDPGDQGKQVSFLSRRHAHIFRKGGGAYIEDLASTNGTFVDGMRLQEHAVPLEDGVLVAFGGEHFTYRVGIRKEAAGATARAPALRSELRTAQRPVEAEPAARDKTTFVAAPTSFLEIFCAEDEPEQRVASGALVPAVVPNAPVEPLRPVGKRRSRSRAVVLITEVLGLFLGHDGAGARRGWWKLAAVGALLAASAVGLFQWGRAERALKDALERGDYAQAAVLANQRLLEKPDDVDVRSTATDATLKAHVPEWLAKLRARDFDAAQAVLARMSESGAGNPDLRPLINELEWLGSLQKLISTRGGAEAPIRIYFDEDRITALIARWNDNTGEHQRALARIASYVPQFAEPYAEALTQLRKLQSEATVYLTAIDRLKAAIATEMGRDEPQALEAVLKETAEKYPGLGGLDSVRQDLAQYIELRREARGRRSGRLLALLLKARFATPPFQDAFRALSASQQLPPPQVVQQYAAATEAWKQGRTAEGVAALQKAATGAWGDALLQEAQRRQGVMAQYAALQSLRASPGYAEQLLAFRAVLDPEQDVHFARATQSDVDAQKDRALARAQEAMNRARALWQEYRSNGTIEARQRVETVISSTFRARARLLADAAQQAQQALEIHRLVDAAAPAPFVATREEIRAEVELQRGALQELRNVLDPELLRSKLALLGDTK